MRGMVNIVLVWGWLEYLGEGWLEYLGEGDDD